MLNLAGFAAGQQLLRFYGENVCLMSLVRCMVKLLNNNPANGTRSWLFRSTQGIGRNPKSA